MGLIGTTGAIRGTIVALRAMKIALIATGIGAFVVILGSIVAAMMRFTVFTDNLKIALSPLGALLNIIMDRLGRLGFALVELASGNVKGAIENYRKAFEELGDEIEREIGLARELKRVSSELERDSKLFEAQKEAVLT